MRTDGMCEHCAENACAPGQWLCPGCLADLQAWRSEHEAEVAAVTDAWQRHVIEAEEGVA